MQSGLQLRCLGRRRWGALGSEREELTGDWRKLHDKKLRDMYWSPSLIWVIKSEIVMGGACGTEGFDGET